MTALKKGSWIGAFLKRLRETGNVTAAAQEAGISRQGAYQYRAGHPEFHEQWEEAVESAVDESEQRLRDIAMGRAGKVQATEVTALIFYLKGRRKAVFGEGRVNVNVAADSSPEAIAKAIRATAAAMDVTVPGTAKGGAA